MRCEASQTRDGHFYKLQLSTTFLQVSTLYDAPEHSNGLSHQSTPTFTWILSDLQRPIKAHTYEQANVTRMQPFTRVIWP
ncbi:hypothetical protein TNCV_1403391 [Trichonephila clavipes]|nr:hypothetical protein TNCV_1403391 [Trichonephila clavipes]